MVHKLSVNAIRDLGFEWPKYPLIEEYSTVEAGKVDLDGTLDRMRSSRAFYQKQLRDAYNFKMQTGADYADFTDRFDEYARMDRDLATAIAYLREIIDAAS